MKKQNNKLIKEEKTRIIQIDESNKSIRQSKRADFLQYLISFDENIGFSHGN